MKIKYIGFYLFIYLLALPLPLKYSAIALIFMVVNGICFINLNSIKTHKWMILGLIFVLLDPIRGLIFERDFFNNIDVTKLSFLVIPILFVNIKNVLKNQKKYFFCFFILGVLSYVLYAIGYMIYFYNTYKNYTFSPNDSYIMYMLYNYLPGAYHHTYIGIYMSLSIILLIDRIIILKNIYKKVVLLFLLSIIIYMQVYIGSKMTILITFLSIMLYLIISVNNNKKLMLIITSIIVLFMTLGLIIKDWLIISIKNSLGHRIEYSLKSIELLKENFFFGVGLKNIKSFEVLVSGEKKPLIPHNLYIHDFLSNGFLGFLFILYIFFYLLKKANKSKDTLFITFVFMTFILGFTEDFLYLQRGVFFFLFFSSIFIYTQTTNNSYNEK